MEKGITSAVHSTLFQAILATAFIHIRTNFARLTKLNNDVLHVNFTRRLSDFSMVPSSPLFLPTFPAPAVTLPQSLTNTGVVDMKNLKCCICKMDWQRVAHVRVRECVCVCVQVCVCLHNFIDGNNKCCQRLRQQRGQRGEPCGWAATAAEVSSAKWIAYLYKFQFQIRDDGDDDDGGSGSGRCCIIQLNLLKTKEATLQQTKQQQQQQQREQCCGKSAHASGKNGKKINRKTKKQIAIQNFHF